MSIKFENNKLRNLNKFNFDILMKLFSINDKIFKKTIIYYNFINRFNVYINLHFDEIAFEYVIFNNVVIFRDINFKLKRNSFLINFYLTISKLIFCI